MGAFASIIKSDKVEVPQEKRKELGEKMYKLMTLAGMMEDGSFSLFGKTYRTLKPIQFNDDGFYFCYNYFEDDFWETAGYDEKKGRFWSNKIGHRQFALGILAGYALEGAYLPGLSAVDYDGHVSTGKAYLMWANTVLGEHYRTSNGDPWEIYLLLKELGQEKYYSINNFSGFWYTLNGFMGLMDIIAVTKGIQAVVDELGKEQEEDESDEDYRFRLDTKDDVNYMLKTVCEFKKNSTMPIDEQYEHLIELVRDTFVFSIRKDILEKYKANNLEVLYCRILIMSYIGIIGKIIANVYEKDFWEVWDRIKDVAKRDTTKSKIYDYETDEYFQVSKDDLIYFWTKEKPIEFSESLQEWLQGLKGRFDQIMAEGVDMQSPLRRIKNIIDFGESHYYKLLLFEDFINETMDNIADKRFMALWMLFDEVLHDQENLEAAKVVIEHVEWDSLANEYRCGIWWLMSNELRFNKGRQAMRRFVALMANKGLRNKVFGF